MYDLWIDLGSFFNGTNGSWFHLSQHLAGVDGTGFHFSQYLDGPLFPEIHVQSKTCSSCNFCPRDTSTCRLHTSVWLLCYSHEPRGLQPFVM